MHTDQQLIRILKNVENGLIRHFHHDWIVIDGCATHVDEIVEELQRHIADIERNAEAFALWADEVTSLHDALRYEIKPLLASVHSFVAEELGFDSPLLRDFGFKPGAVLAPEEED